MHFMNLRYGALGFGLLHGQCKRHMGVSSHKDLHHVEEGTPRR